MKRQLAATYGEAVEVTKQRPRSTSASSFSPTVKAALYAAAVSKPSPNYKPSTLATARAKLHEIRSRQA